ncbi:hypothetical protein HYR54_15570 [Candidatus Acetothermia bacterium]|nr:hypothetical protein [Candidatus Acetothermia bacterium]
MYSFRYEDPRLAGVIIREAVRCGKPNCRCARGRPHRWYYYCYYRVLTPQGWRLRKKYVPKAQVRSQRRKIRTAKDQERLYKVEMKETQFLLKLVEDQLRQMRQSNVYQ